MSFLKTFIFCLSVIFYGALSNAAETLSMSHVPGKPVTIGAALCNQLPEADPEFTLQLFEKHFTVTIKSPILPGEKPVCKGKADDDESMFAGDVSEFFISTDPKQKIYYQIALNPAGLVYSARKRDNSWNPRIKTQVSQTQSSWSIQISIPYSEINTTAPTSKTVWRANFAAKVKAGTTKKSCNWSNAQDFHNIADFGTIRFDNKELPKVLEWNTRNCAINAKMYIPAEYPYGTVFCEVNGKQYPSVKNGTLHTWKIPLVSNYTFPKHIYNSKIVLLSKDGKVIYSRQGTAEPAEPKNLILNSFYYTPDMTELTYRHNFASDAQLTLKNSLRQVIARMPAKSSGKLSLAGLSPGRYVLELAAKNQRTSRYIQLVPQNFSLPAIGKNDRFEIRNGIFHLGNKPVFLIGASTTPQNHLQFANAFSMKTGNLGTVPNAVDFNGLGHTRFLRVPFSCCYLHKNADKIIQRRMAKQPEGNRSVIRLAYEAQIRLYQGDIKAIQKMDTVKYYAQLYKKLKTQYPGRYFSIHIDRRERLNDFLSSCDIFEYASWRSSYAVNMMPFLVPDMQELRKKTGSRPVVFWLGGSIPDPRCRLAEELRAAVYCAIISDLNGVIFHLGHGGLSAERSRLWSLISGINTEIMPVYQEFVSGKEIKNFFKEVKGNFLYAARQCKENICILAVNLNGAEQTLDMKTSAGNFKFLLTPFEPVYIRLKKH